MNGCLLRADKCAVLLVLFLGLCSFPIDLFAIELSKTKKFLPKQVKEELPEANVEKSEEPSVVITNYDKDVEPIKMRKTVGLEESEESEEQETSEEPRKGEEDTGRRPFFLSYRENPTTKDLEDFVRLARVKFGAKITGTPTLSKKKEKIKSVLPMVVDMLKCIRTNNGFFDRKWNEGTYLYSFPASKLKVYYSPFVVYDKKRARLLCDFCGLAYNLGISCKEQEWSELLQFEDDDIIKQFCLAVADLLDAIRGRIMPVKLIKEALKFGESEFKEVLAKNPYGKEVNTLYAEFVEGMPEVKGSGVAKASLPKKYRTWVEENVLTAPKKTTAKKIDKNKHY